MPNLDEITCRALLELLPGLVFMFLFAINATFGIAYEQISFFDQIRGQRTSKMQASFVPVLKQLPCEILNLMASNKFSRVIRFCNNFVLRTLVKNSAG